jgi:hypothetical protein
MQSRGGGSGSDRINPDRVWLKSRKGDCGERGDMGVARLGVRREKEIKVWD